MYVCYLLFPINNNNNNNVEAQILMCVLESNILSVLCKPDGVQLTCG